MSKTALNAAATILRRRHLPSFLAASVAATVPADHPDPAKYLEENFTSPNHETLAHYLGNQAELWPRLLGLISRVKNARNEDLVAAGLRALPGIIDKLNEDIRDIPDYVFISLKRAINRERRYLRRMTQTKDDRAYSTLLTIPPRTSQRFFEQVASLYLDFHSICQDEQQQQILEARWNLSEDFNSGCRYAEEIAEQLNLPVEQVVAELEDMQRLYLRLVNGFRQSRNNPRFPALKPRPIQRIHKPLSINDLEDKTDDSTVSNDARPSRRRRLPQACAA